VGIIKADEIKELFNEVLAKYCESQETVIYDHGSGIPGKTEADEINDLKDEIEIYKKRLGEILEEN
jgi:hypothetical protein